MSIALKWVNSSRERRSLTSYLAVCAALALLTYAGFSFRFNPMTISFLYLLLVIAVAWRYGFWQASFLSLLAVLCLDYYFLPPILHFDIDDPMDWVALAEFEATALIVSRLSARESRTAMDSAIHRAGMEQLYELSRSSLLLDMRQALGPQLAILIQRIFGVKAVALFDANLGRQDRAGEWGAGEEDIAKECFLLNAARDDAATKTSQRILLSGSAPTGALAVRGDLSPLVIDALAALSALALDRHEVIEKEEQAENASKSEQLRAAVMDALAHEIKTPLTAVQAASSGLLELGGLSARQRDLVALIDSESVRLNELCTRLLLTARLEARQIGLDLGEVKVQEAIDAVLASRPELAETNRIRVAVADGDLAVRVDRGLLETILAQYLDNALKYSTPGTPVQVTARKSRDEVLFSVHNFGSAIRIEDRERIFERFYRSEGSKEAVAGTGIGLSVVRKAAEAHHGHVWAISDGANGTTFFLSLPTGATRQP
jgi:two-component system sensor histidine kinase KdpD